MIVIWWCVCGCWRYGKCTLRFAPYGFRATFHHLVDSARISRRLQDDPQALERAVAELEEGRQVWVEHSRAYAARRRHEKTAGRRTVPPEPLALPARVAGLLP